MKDRVKGVNKKKRFQEKNPGKVERRKYQKGEASKYIPTSFHLRFLLFQFKSVLVPSLSRRLFFSSTIS
jgi:hypothetical protein